ncbi:MAG: DUF4215 domain-containing protein [Candidatus Portnoybacteria bacterium]|nr:DUF4215 domain-containing protein [Candidatus Portnoybacteria bacterium]
MKTKKLFIKFISIILLFSLLVGMGSFSFLRPKMAKSFIPGITSVPITEVGDFGPDFIKENILDLVVKSMAKTFIQQMIRDISQWARGGFRDDNQPFAVTDWNRYLKNAVNVGSAIFIGELGLTELCLPFKDLLGIKLGLGYLNMYLPDYQYYAACTIEKIVENVEDFWENPSISTYGWGAWAALAQPQNNIYGSFLLGVERRAELESDEKEKKEKEATVSGGYKNFTECIEENSAGMCLREQLKTTGSEIHETLKTSIWAELEWLISADEISELLGAFITGIYKRLISGFYDYQDPSQPPPPHPPQTPAEQEEVIVQIREGIFENIKNLSQNINQSELESQLSMTEIGDIVFTLFEQRTIQLYSSLEGINPKVDSVIPDDYPLQVAEWISQAVVQYPLVAKINICIGGPVRMLTTTCQSVLASEIEFPGSCSIESINPDCLNCTNPLCLLISAAIRSHSRFCNALSLDKSWCEREIIIEPEIYCGDGILDPEEECDDNNNISGDGCSATCRLEIW